MVTYRKKKTRRFYGRPSHGAGSRKKNRGAGSRGGRGNAGSGKRAGHKVAGTTFRIGRHGFTRRRTTSHLQSINLGYFTPERLEVLLAAGKIGKEGEFYVLNLPQLGYNKLLGEGVISAKLKITVPKLSAQAEEKVTAAGGMFISAEEKRKEYKNQVSKEANKKEEKAAKKTSA